MFCKWMGILSLKRKTVIRIEIFIDRDLLTRSVALGLSYITISVGFRLSIELSTLSWLYLSASKQLVLLSVFSCVLSLFVCQFSQVI